MTFTADEARRIVQNLWQVEYDRGPGTNLIVTVERSNGSEARGILAFLDDKPDSFSIVLDQPPGNEHVDVPWDDVARIAVEPQ
jgi:hypothetical protein